MRSTADVERRWSDAPAECYLHGVSAGWMAADGVSRPRAARRQGRRRQRRTGSGRQGAPPACRPAARGERGGAARAPDRGALAWEAARDGGAACPQAPVGAERTARRRGGARCAGAAGRFQRRLSAAGGTRRARPASLRGARRRGPGPDGVRRRRSRSGAWPRGCGGRRRSKSSRTRGSHAPR